MFEGKVKHLIFKPCNGIYDTFMKNQHQHTANANIKIEQKSIVSLRHGKKVTFSFHLQHTNNDIILIT